jgi:hypothetical protein
VGAAGALTTTNTFTGAQTFTPSSAAITPITINGAFNQTADLLDIKNYSATSLLAIDSSGRVVVGNTIVGQNQNYLTVQNTTATGMYPWEAANLAIRDSRSLSASVGGGIIFEGNYLNTAPSVAAFAGIKGTKFNTTSGDVKGFLDLWSRGGGGIRMYTSEQIIGSESASPAIQIGVAGDTYLKGYNPTVSFTMSAYNDTSKQQIIVADNEQMKYYSLSPNGPGHLWYTGNTTSGTAGASLRMAINLSGYVGISTSAPSTWLQISNANGNVNDGIGMINIQYSGTARINASYTASNYYGTSQFMQWESYGLRIGSRIQSNSGDGAIVFTYGTDSEGMRLDKNGYLLVGYGSSVGGYKLQVNGSSYLLNGYSTSDKKYKKNIKSLSGGIDVVKALKPVEFDWIQQKHITDKDGKVLREKHEFPEHKNIGFIAQDIQEVLKGKDWLKNIVSQNTREAIKDEDGKIVVEEESYLAVSEMKLVPVLVQAIQELTARLEKLEGNK